MKILPFLLYMLWVFSLAALPTEQDRIRYGGQMNEAFQLQSRGKTREAYAKFKGAYQEALSLGENRERLFLIQELFVWYRQFGYSLGIMSEPAKCTGEEPRCASRSMRSRGWNRSEDNTRRSEWGNDPIQGGKIRDAMLGFGELISAVLMITIGTPPVKIFGATVAWDGFGRIWNACNGLYVDYECAALQRLRDLEAEAKALPSP